MIQYVAVLPAYAGMFPGVMRLTIIAKGSPRVCGDVSGDRKRFRVPFRFSPRMRGCFMGRDL